MSSGRYNACTNTCWSTRLQESVSWRTPPMTRRHKVVKQHYKWLMPQSDSLWSESTGCTNILLRDEQCASTWTPLGLLSLKWGHWFYLSNEPWVLRVCAISPQAAKSDGNNSPLTKKGNRNTTNSRKSFNHAPLAGYYTTCADRSNHLSAWVTSFLITRCSDIPLLNQLFLICCSYECKTSRLLANWQQNVCLFLCKVKNKFLFSRGFQPISGRFAADISICNQKRRKCWHAIDRLGASVKSKLIAINLYPSRFCSFIQTPLIQETAAADQNCCLEGTRKKSWCGWASYLTVRGLDGHRSLSARCLITICSGNIGSLTVLTNYLYRSDFILLKQPQASAFRKQTEVKRKWFVVCKHFHE